MIWGYPYFWKHPIILAQLIKIVAITIPCSPPSKLSRKTQRLQCPKKNSDYLVTPGPVRVEIYVLQTIDVLTFWDILPWEWKGNLPNAIPPTWRIIPVSKWLVTPVYKPFRPFARGTTLLIIVINHLRVLG